MFVVGLVVWWGVEQCLCEVCVVKLGMDICFVEVVGEEKFDVFEVIFCCGGKVVEECVFLVYYGQVGGKVWYDRFLKMIVYLLMSCGGVCNMVM